MPENLPETEEHQQFLLQLPDDLKDACLNVEQNIRERAIEGRLTIGELVVAIRTELKLPQNLGTTIVMCNAAQEAIDLCGFASPEIIFEKLRERKDKLLTKEENI